MKDIINIIQVLITVFYNIIRTILICLDTLCRNLFGEKYLTYVIIAAALYVIITIIRLILKSPFKYPYFVWKFDVSGRRNPRMQDLIDGFFIENRFDLIDNHRTLIEKWKEKCERRIKRSLLKKYRRKQYEKCVDDLRAYRFQLTRVKTRYKQKHYVKRSYKAAYVAQTFAYSYQELLQRYNKLKEINFECTLAGYHSKNQRRLMTRELREQIMIRDNYTCRICGKYMPDEVGLHIDHIIPVAKGGKTVPSNLQVLCSKCNGRKSDKTDSQNERQNINNRQFTDPD